VIPASEAGHRARGYYIGAGVFMILLSIAGFGPSILDQSTRNGPLTPMVIAHGVASVAWILLFLLQAALVATGRTAVHRRVGALGPLLAVVLLAMGAVLLIDFARRGYDLSGDVVRLFARPGAAPPSASQLAPVRLSSLAILVQFGALVIAGIWYRHRPEVHKRLMLLALLTLASAPILALAGVVATRWPTLQGPAIASAIIITSGMLFTSAIFDLMSKRRLHPASWLVPVLLLGWRGSANLVAGSAWWRDVAIWMIR
jgi:hypothetical protein